MALLVRLAKAALGSVVALAGATAAISTALYIVLPKLEPRDKLGAELTHLAVAQNVGYREYEYQTGFPVDKERWGDFGVMVWVHANLAGYEDRKYSVRVRAYDAKSLEVIEPTDIHVTFATCEMRSPDAREDGVAWRCWLTMPPPGIEYFVRAELVDNGNLEELEESEITYANLLYFQDSKAVTVVEPEA
ncbi:hypothetical protein [Nocardioides sp. NPDC006273]|uniref:hypothetical protein n=1 Tax=Nocardioides sp. NPDC006273 TaxID=3155598 RepID=UPI0033A2ABB3